MIKNNESEKQNNYDGGSQSADRTNSNGEEDKKIKNSILLPYNLEVMEVLHNLEKEIKQNYSDKKNSMDLKSLEPQKEIEITINISDENDKKNPKNPFVMLYNLVERHSDLNSFLNLKKDQTKDWVNEDKRLKLKIILLMLARILHFDQADLWEQINHLIDTRVNPRDKKIVVITQPFYTFKYNTKTLELSLVVKDHVVIPKNFVASYFGFDTGIDGLNLLMNGGFLLPPDRSAYISISGEAGIGKTALVLKLITAFYQNYTFKNVYRHSDIDKKRNDLSDKLTNKDASLLSLHYILMEQSKNNIIRLLKDCDLINVTNTIVKSVLIGQSQHNSKSNFKEYAQLTSEDIEKVIEFREQETFSPMDLVETIEKIERGDPYKPENSDDKIPNYRKIIVIDSVNAIQDIDISRTEWRELFQSIKAITKNSNTIVFFIVEKKPDQPDFFIEYLSDVVIKLHKEYQGNTCHRIMELVESRFQTIFHGKHKFFITRPSAGFIRVYPSCTALAELIPHRKRVQPPITNLLGNKKEVGIKIDGIINFFKYTHLHATRMEPFFLKNSICMFTGDRGAHKSAFAKKFALSAFRDERWESDTCYIVELDYRQQEANKPWEELVTIGFWNAKPVEKAISLMLYFSENYNENPEEDIIWETHFGKIIIPGCKIKERRYVGYISHIVCSYEVKELPEEVYLYQLDELIRAIENSSVRTVLPLYYIDFLRRSSLSLIDRDKKEIIDEKEEKSIYFNPYNNIYKGDYIRDFNIDSNLLKEIKRRELSIMLEDDDFIVENISIEYIANFIKKGFQELMNSDYSQLLISLMHSNKKLYRNIRQEANAINRISSSHKKEDVFLKKIKLYLDHLINLERIIPEEITEKRDLKSDLKLFIHKVDFLRRMLVFQHLIDESDKNNKNTKKFTSASELFNNSLLPPNTLKTGRFENESFIDYAIDYQYVKKVKVSRIILDDAENLDNVYTSITPQKYLSTLAHLCLAREITLGIVNTRSKDETSEVDTVCNEISDNAFQFDKYFFKGELFTTFHIIRSAGSCHNNMMYYLTKRGDGLLQLNNTFSLLSNVENQNPEPIEIRLFLPDLSKEFSKYMFRLLIERDMQMMIEGGNAELNTANTIYFQNQKWKRHFSKRYDFASQFKIKDIRNGSESIYNMQERFPSIFKDWQDFLKDMITYSLAHPKVEVFTANDPFTDISIILEDESAKDAVTILCLPGYLMDLYERNLTTISNFVHFAGCKDNQPIWVRLRDQNKWIHFEELSKENTAENHDKYKIKFGNEFHYLQKAAIRIPEKYTSPPIDKPSQTENNENKKNTKKENCNKQQWIIPDILFNPAIARNEKTNEIIRHTYNKKLYLDIKGYPYYIDPRVNLVFSYEDCGKVDDKPDYVIHNTAHDLVALFFELWYKNILSLGRCNNTDCRPKEDDTSREKKTNCTYCFFEQAQTQDENDLTSPPKNPKVIDTIYEFVDLVARTVQFDNDGLILKIKKLDPTKPGKIVLREWYCSAQQKLNVLEPLLLAEKSGLKVSLQIPQYFLYTTWYLAIPINSPRKELASELITKMTEPQDLAHLLISGIGMQLSDRIYKKGMEKYYPEYNYNAVRDAMERLINGGNHDTVKNRKLAKLGIPIASIHCWFESLTLLGGVLLDFYKHFMLLYSEKQPDSPTLNAEKEVLIKKLCSFSNMFKKWQRDEKERCESCYMTYLFCPYKDPVHSSETKSQKTSSTQK